MKHLFKIRPLIITLLLLALFSTLTHITTVGRPPVVFIPIGISLFFTLTILWIAIPLSIQTTRILSLDYELSKILPLTYQLAAPSTMSGASNHFELAIATATMLCGLSSGAALATLVGVLIEVPVMLMQVKICLKTTHCFQQESE